MTYDPFQTYPGLGAYSGMATQFGTPYNPLAFTQGINPTMGINPQFGQQQGHSGIPGYGGIHPHQLQQLQQLQQLAAILTAQAAAQQWQHQSPYATWQNPLLSGLAQNPQALSGLQNPLCRIHSCRIHCRIRSCRIPDRYSDSNSSRLTSSRRTNSRRTNSRPTSNSVSSASSANRCSPRRGWASPESILWRPNSLDAGSAALLRGREITRACRWKLHRRVPDQGTFRGEHCAREHSVDATLQLANRSSA